MRVLQFLTVPDTQICGVLAIPKDLSVVVEAVLAEWRSIRHTWDLVELADLPTDGTQLPVLVAACRHHGLPTSTRPDGVNPWIPLDTDWTQFYADRSRRLKKANNSNANRLHRAFRTVDIEWLTRESVEPIRYDALLLQLIELSAKSWKHTTGLTLNYPAPQAFIRRLVQHAYKDDWLSIFLLRLDGQAAAMEFQLIYKGHVHALRADYDEALSRHSPGSYLNWKLLQTLFGFGLLRYWMGPGDNPYKAHWTETADALSRLRIYGTTLRGQFFRFWDQRLRHWFTRKPLRPRTVPKSADGPDLETI